MRCLSPLKLEALLLTSCSRLFFLLLITAPVPGLTGGAIWSPQTWSVLVEMVLCLAATWVKFCLFHQLWSICRCLNQKICPSLKSIFLWPHLPFRETLAVPWTARILMAPGMSMELWALAQVQAVTTTRSPLSSPRSAPTHPGSTM